MADKIHCVKKTLRLTPAESRLLSEKAEALHMNEAEYLRLLITSLLIVTTSSTTSLTIMTKLRP